MVDGEKSMNTDWSYCLQRSTHLFWYCIIWGRLKSCQILSMTFLAEISQSLVHPNDRTTERQNHRTTEPQNPHRATKLVNTGISSHHAPGIQPSSASHSLA